MSNVVNLEGVYDFSGEPKVINLDDWEWLRELDGNQVHLVEQYKEKARKNEILMVQIYGKDAYNVYVPSKIPSDERNNQTPNGETERVE